MTKDLGPRPLATDVAKRLIILKYVIVYALTAPPRDVLKQLFRQWSAKDREDFEAEAILGREKHWQRLRQTEIWNAVSPIERELADTTIVSMTHEQQLNASWRMESACVLMWSLGMIPSLPRYDEQASHDPLKRAASEGIDQFLTAARLRDPVEIDFVRSDAELWHWRSRTRQLIDEGRKFPADEKTRAAGFESYDDVVRFTARKQFERGRIAECTEEDFVAFGKAYRNLTTDEWSEVRSITMERHYALNWLCGYAPGNRWELTPTST